MSIIQNAAAFLLGTPAPAAAPSASSAAPSTTVATATTITTAPATSTTGASAAHDAAAGAMQQTSAAAQGAQTSNAQAQAQAQAEARARAEAEAQRFYAPPIDLPRNATSVDVRAGLARAMADPSVNESSAQKLFQLHQQLLEADKAMINVILSRGR